MAAVHAAVLAALSVPSSAASGSRVRGTSHAMENGSYFFTEAREGRNVCRLPRVWVCADVVPDDVVPEGKIPTTSTRRGSTANASLWGTADAGTMRVKDAERPGPKLGPRAVRTPCVTSCWSTFVSAHCDTASRLVSG